MKERNEMTRDQYRKQLLDDVIAGKTSAVESFKAYETFVQKEESMLCPICTTEFCIYGEDTCPKCAFQLGGNEPKPNPKELYCTWDDNVAVML
jgi:hypothetical protein